MGTGPQESKHNGLDIITHNIEPALVGPRFMFCLKYSYTILQVKVGPMIPAAFVDVASWMSSLWIPFSKLAPHMTAKHFVKSTETRTDEVAPIGKLGSVHHGFHAAPCYKHLHQSHGVLVLLIRMMPAEIGPPA